MAQRFVPRRHRRFPAHLTAVYLGPRCGGQARVMDLSLTGWRLESTTPVELGTRLSLRVYLHGDDPPLSIDRAVVRWVDGHEFGVELEAVRSDARLRLREWVGLQAQYA